MPRRDGDRPVERLRTLLGERLGMAFDDKKDALLGEILQQRATQHGLTERGYLDRLTTAWSAELAALAEALTVNETYFFRNVEQFRALAEVVLPARMRAGADRRRLDLLSVGCSTGEEAYSLAMVVAGRVPESWEASIVGLDVDRGALRKAMAGRYSEWSLRETPQAARHKWFRPAGDGVEIDDRLRKRVRFVEHNVARDDPVLFAPGLYDVVFCRNLLMYLTPDTARTVVERITRSLAPGGYLFLGHTDTLGARPPGLAVQHSHGTFYYERVAQPQRPADPAPAVRPQPRERALALTLLQQERFGEGLRVLDAITGAEADRPETWLVRGCLLAGLGDTGRAAQLCRRLLDRDALYADAHQLLADCHEGDERPDAAQRHHRVAAQLDPGFAMPRLRLGLLARRTGDRKEAERELDSAVHLLRSETDERIVLFGGGFGRSALIALCRAELAAVS
ncbi:CheR family methyltransferase [Dactylosporangium matsuzakiense]|uniref:Protein-glutamate O-methyltransferase n=1 Tax=Dactylosporangium matsuzakiense TaxID=53360 RepID=A0A9W6NQS4_9ACTN|nr:CheR family methyltransferase [Dactylosporangium matsuzakiense]GLL05546.1 protein-glutamate O-methyltransferase [Dactylosporangium matsuzakiense]